MTPIDETAEKIGVCHETAFNMRHKLLAYMESMTESLALLDELVEADETYVFESQKGIKCVDRKPRKHGKGASKRGLSNELYCVCVATDRNDNLVATCVNRAKPSGDDLGARGYRLKIFDAYRPQMAVTHFMNWALDPEDARMKEYFYPELEKDQLFPQGYIAEHSGHSRGSTVDLTLFDMTTEKEVDMGGTFDYFGERSHPDYTGSRKSSFRTGRFSGRPCWHTASGRLRRSGGISRWKRNRTRIPISPSRSTAVSLNTRHWIRRREVQAL